MLTTRPSRRGSLFIHYFLFLNIVINKSYVHMEKGPIVKESEGPLSVVRTDEICSDYFPPIVSIPLPDRRTKSHIGNRKLPPIVGPKSDMADYHRLPPIIIFSRRKFSQCPIFHPIFYPTLRSSGFNAKILTLHFIKIVFVLFCISCFLIYCQYTNICFHVFLSQRQVKISLTS